MKFHEELLDQAKHLLERHEGSSQQADLRRAVSTAYYAIFHFMIAESCRRFLGDDPQNEQLRQVLTRAFVHEEMATTSKTFMSGTLPEGMRGQFPIIPPGLKVFSYAFVQLQDRRYSADYDLSFQFKRKDVEVLIKTAEDVILDWKLIEDHPTTHLYLVMLLTGKQIRARKFAGTGPS